MTLGREPAQLAHWVVTVILNSPVTWLGGTRTVPLCVEVSIDSIESKVMTLVLGPDPRIRIEVKEPVCPELVHVVVADPD